MRRAAALAAVAAALLAGCAGRGAAWLAVPATCRLIRLETGRTPAGEQATVAFFTCPPESRPASPAAEGAVR